MTSFGMCFKDLRYDIFLSMYICNISSGITAAEMLAFSSFLNIFYINIGMHLCIYSKVW